MFIKEAY